MIRETVGKVSSDLIKKPHETTSPVEQMREQLGEYDKNIMECVERNKKDFPGDFYVVVLTKRERLMQNVLRNYFYGRVSCPTPDWDQAVYKYNRKDDGIIFMWVIPSKQSCEEMMMNKHLIPLEEYKLLEYVLAFHDGTLLRIAKKLNGEKLESVELQDFTFKG
jgi:hypothetical protein